MKELVIYGAGGHAKSVVDSLDLSKYHIAYFIDNFKSGVFLDKPIVAASFLDKPEAKNYCYFVAIGDNKVRKAVFELIKNKGFELINIIDHTAIISKTAKIGVGCFFGKYSIANADSKIGDNVIINTRALVEHECVVENNIHISTNSVLNGGVIVEEGAFVGSCTVVNELKRIGKWSVVGSGSVVISDVTPGTVFAGVPAKYKKDVTEHH